MPAAPAAVVVTAMFDFAGTDADELPLKQGDKVTVLEKDSSGWWRGSANGKTGIFPANYVE